MRFKRNRLLTSKNMIKLADLGMAKFMEGSTTDTLKGTRANMSPETFKCFLEDDAKYTIKSDIWFGSLSLFIDFKMLKIKRIEMIQVARMCSLRIGVFKTSVSKGSNRRPVDS